MTRGKVSIIVPVYNVREYLSRCITSIIEQSYTDFELILIDDGSTDGSELICQEFALKDSRIRVFHQKNSGVSSARNLGIKKSKGEYIYFVDSDDFVDTDILLNLVNSIQGVDLSICNYYTTKNGGKKIKSDMSNKRLSQSELAELILSKRYFCGYCWNKLYKANIIKDNNILFRDSINILEDLIFNCEYISYIKEGYYIKNPLYFYCYRDTSALNNRKIITNNKESLIAIDTLTEIYEKSFPNYIYLIRERYVKTVFFIVYLYKINNVSVKLLNEEIQKAKNLKKDIFWKISLQNKIELFLVSNFPYLYGKLRDILRKE